MTDRCFGLPADDVARIFSEGVMMPDGVCIRLQTDDHTGAWFFSVLGVDVYCTPNWEGQSWLRVQVSADADVHSVFTVYSGYIHDADEYRVALCNGWERILRAVSTALLYRAQLVGGLA